MRRRLRLSSISFLPFFYRIKTFLKTKNPAGLIQQGLKIPKRLTFRELEALARTRLAIFFAFAHARIACEQSFSLQRRTQRGVEFDQRAGNAVTNRVGLAVRPAARDVH